jgi:Ser/Thr protein kinase RdoA (MazF antagonist)
MSQSRRSLADPELAAALLPLWGFPPDSRVTPAAEQGTNNQTFLVHRGRERYVLRVSGFASAAAVQAEHRILRHLLEGSLPFAVPEPIATTDGQTAADTPSGLATVCRWLPGLRLRVEDETAFERFGRVTGMLSAGLAAIPLADAWTDWRTDPRWVRPGDPPVEVLCDELRTAGLNAGHAELLVAAASRAGRWWPSTEGLPAQVIHGDLAPSNMLADPATGEVTGILDFELAGAGFRVQDILFALYNSGALDSGTTGTPDWPRRTTAFLRGCASVRRLEPAEVAALPELLVIRALGSALWRISRWRSGPGSLGEVTAHAARLAEAVRWLAVNEDRFRSVAVAANAGS